LSQWTRLHPGEHLLRDDLRRRDLRQ